MTLNHTHHLSLLHSFELPHGLWKIFFHTNSIPFSEIMLPFKQAFYYIRTSYIINLSNSLLTTTLPMQDKVPSNVVFGSSWLMNGKKHILLDNIGSLPYSLCHWQHILYDSSRQCTHAIYTRKSVICYICSIYKYSLSHWQHILFKAVYTSNLHLQISHLCYICSIYKYCIMAIPVTIRSTLLIAEKELNYSVSQKKSDMSAGHT
jgi:hypothetical protein